MGKRKMVIRLGLFFLVLCCLSCLSKPKTNQKTPGERPNIILILSDDMGYSDIASYGGEIKTPNLSYLSDNGLKYTQFYNFARCCPTRAALMTGCYPHQTGIGHMTNTPVDSTSHDYGTPEYQGKLNFNTVTIAEVLKEAGYRTYMTGKWHLGYHDRETWPQQRGFDKFYGLIPGASNFFKPTYPRGISSGNDTISINDPDFYTTDAFTDMAISFIDSPATDKEEPFFLYLAYTAPHWPIQAPKENIDTYRDRYDQGWEKLREQRFSKMMEMGLLDTEWELSPSDAPQWDSLSLDKKNEMSLRREIYAGMVDRMDENIGKLIEYLKATDRLDNTLILFTNDNGACAEGGMFGGGPASQLETEEGYFLTYGKAWANASNTPFREYKHWVHEGGIATPLIVHWPKGIKKDRKGKTVRQPGSVQDLMATCIDVAGAKYPEHYNGNTIVPHSGKSIVPTFTDNSTVIHHGPLFWEHEGNKAVRLGKFKLVQKWQHNKTQKWELYDMEKDRTEMNDIALQHSGLRDSMALLYAEWAKKINVLPWDEAYGIWKSKSKNQ
ncbi:MAG: arylsulfatase [Bacteroidota bacterium]